MSAVSMWLAASCKSHVHPGITKITEIESGRTKYCLHSLTECRCPSPHLIGEIRRKWYVSQCGPYLPAKAEGRQLVGQVNNRLSSLRMSRVTPLLEVSNIEGYENCSLGISHQRCPYYASDQLDTGGSYGTKLEELDSYFSKLQCDMDEQFKSNGNGSDAKGYLMASFSHMDDLQRKVGKENTLASLENYFGQLDAVQHSRKGAPSTSEKQNLERHSIRRPDSVVGKYCKSPESLQNTDVVSNLSGDEIAESLPSDEEASDFYLLNILVAINIAVFLFEIASPVRSSDVENLTIPLAYGAKINKLILDGEWWRLLTPMFLHTGLLHVALSSWVLFTFGPQVNRGYGPFTFLLIYVLGGICGNLTSFIHTPELTVCGTGPVFAIIGAWLVYQIQNKQVVAKDLSESMFWKAVAATAMSFLLCNFGRIDDWTHLGAALSGIIFGYLTCPSLQLLKDGQKEGMTLVQRQADPCKSLLVFAVSMLILSSLLVFYGPQLELLEMEEFV